MTVNAPLAVRVDDGVTDRAVTKYTSGLSFTKTAPGGHQSCRFRLNLPRDTFTELGPQDRCWIDDKRTARRIFGAAYLENPTLVDGPAGQAFDISAMGGMALANDESRALIYIDRDLSVFEKAVNSADAGTVDAGEWDPDNNPATPITAPFYQRVRTTFPNGSVASSGALASAGNYLLEQAGMNLGAIRVTIAAGKTDSGWAQEFVNVAGTVATSALTVGPATLLLYVGTHFTNTARFAFRLRRVGASTNVADDLSFADWVDFSMAGQRMDRFGTLLTGSSGMVSAQTVLASQVVEDLLGRVLRFCDPGTATVEATTFTINQLSYPDGVKAASLLTDLEQWEPDYWWGVHESHSNGLHRFEYRKWATEPRYVVSVQDGWRQKGSDVDLCNRIVVYYTDSTGRRQSVVTTAASLGLVGMGLPVDALGTRTKDADPITLPDGQGSAANAAQIGAAVLRDKINPPLAGTVTVRRPIVDLVTGNTVMPWELEPGWPVLVQEPGYAIRCTEMTYDDPSVAATLTLGNPSPTNEQRLARLARVA